MYVSINLIFRTLPLDATHLPKYVEVFLQRVALTAHDLVLVDNASTFDMSKFNKECRRLLYNTERNEVRRSGKSAETTTSAKGAENAPSTSGTPARTPNPGQDDNDDDTSVEGKDDEFFNFRRSAKVKSGGDTAPEAVVKKPAGSEPSGDETDNEPNSVKKRKASPENESPSKRSARYKLASVWDHLQSVTEDNLNVDDIIRLLRSYNRSLCHRKGMKLACKDLKLLINDIEANDGHADIMELASNYNIALTKLPAIFE